MPKSFYITTPIYYVNASPHIGHAYTTIVADVLARYHRMIGENTFFVTGTDEHGDKIAEASQKAGVTPQEYADKISAQFRNLWPELAVTNDYFIRTTDSNHIETVRYILQKVYDSGDIYFGSYEGFYCVGCERFYMEKELVNGKCPDHKTEPEHRKESNYFFRMSKYQDWLIGHIKENPDFIRPERYRNEVLAFLREPLEDLCISRPKSRLRWGITLPFDQDYVTYVWFDALVNYISAIGWPDDQKSFKKWWTDTGGAVQYCGKDNLRQQSAMWQAMLMAVGLTPSKAIIINGFVTGEGGVKMSKSLGNTVNPIDVVKEYGTDAFRYFVTKELHPFEDSPFTAEKFKEAYNAGLANGLGNLTSRIMKMAEDNVEPLNKGTIEQFAALKEPGFFEAVESFNLQKAMNVIWEKIAILDQKIQKEKPFALVKTDKEKGQVLILELVQSLNEVAVMLSPFLPETSEKILKCIRENKMPEKPLFLRK